MRRKYLSYLLAAVMAVMVLSESAAALTRRQSRYALQHRSMIELRLGMLDAVNDNKDICYDGVITYCDDDDFLVTIGYNYWADERTSFNLSIRVLSSDYVAGIGELGPYSTEYAVVPIFMGFRYYLGRPGMVSPVRPYLTAAAGPVIGTQRWTLLGSDIEYAERTLATIGAHFGGGVDFLVGRRFVLGVNAGYNVMSDFDRPIGGHVNYSGAEFAVGFGFLF